MVKIRAVSAADAPDISVISGEDLGYVCDASIAKDRIRNLHAEREAVYVAVLDAQVVGYVHVERYDVLYFESMANILGLAVKADYRRNGIGKALLHAAEEWAAAHQIKVMRLNSGSTRKEAHAFYRHLGYNLEKEQIRFAKYL